MSSADDDDLPCLAPILDEHDSVMLHRHVISDHIGISIEQLVKDKREEDEKELIHKELLEFKLDDSEEEAEEDVSNSQSSQTVPKPREVVAYGMTYMTGYTSLPEVVFPPPLKDLCPKNTEPDLLVVLPWGPIIRDLFESPAHYQVWLFTVVCYCQDKETCRQACHMLLEEIKCRVDEEEVYEPSADEICGVFADYGASDDMDLVGLYETLEPPSYFTNIRLALKIYCCAVKQIKLASALTVIKHIVRLCQDRHLITSIDYDEYSDILSNILDGLSSFTSREIDQISQLIADNVKSILVAPALCQVIRSGNSRCHLISEQVTLLILSKYCEIETTPLNPPEQSADRQQLHHIILKLAEKNHETEEFGAMCTILDYHINQAVLNKDQLAEVHSALYKLYGEIKEHTDHRLSKYRTGILASISCVFKRIQSGQDTMTMFN